MVREHTVQFRIRYSETDAMGTYYNSRALEWFEYGRTELLRALGKPYREMEAQGLWMPVREAHVEYLSPARYDDLLTMRCRLYRSGPARFRFDVEVVHAESGRLVCRGWTEHVVLDHRGRPIRPPEWLLALVEERSEGPPPDPKTEGLSR
ncbi:MAG TPA: thioesterase family protein [Thermoguttaceae bacterium]|nr:thioesterase family protein [Thermoguttaceae bacterium]HPP54448.1 thioesterase family protein [Thermoguttaceae bacterium]